MKRTILLVFAAAVAGTLLAGCSGGTKWDAASASQAQYATQIPLYPGTRITNAMGSESWGDGADSYTYGMAWWCEAKATQEELIAFYEQQLTGANRRTMDSGGVELRVEPNGGDPGEDMGVWIEKDGEYRIFENRKRKEIRRS
jgi:hypothetical protein